MATGCYDYQFFDKIDNNDQCVSHCMSLVCHQNHKLRKSEIKLDKYTSDMEYVEFFAVFEVPVKRVKSKMQLLQKMF